MRPPSLSFPALLVSLAGGLYVGRSLFPVTDPEREVAQRMAELERKAAERPASGFGTAITGTRLERWPEVVDGWKFMNAGAPATVPVKGATEAVEINLAKLQQEFLQAAEAKRLTLASRLGKAWGEWDPAGALGWAETLPDAAEKSAAQQGIALGWARVDPLAASEWLAPLADGPERQAIAHAFVLAAASSAPGVALAFALAATDPAERAKLVEISLKPAAVLMPEEAATMLAHAEISPAEIHRFQDSLSSYRQGGGGEP